MKAVNLIPADSRRARASTASTDVQAVVYAVVGVLAVGILLMVLYVTSGNQIADHQAQLASLQQQINQTQAKDGQLTNYVSFQQLAMKREQTVASLAAGRFDWAAAMGQVASVVPANTTLSTLNATLSASSGGSGSSVRGDETGPAIELNGCTTSQVGVASLMSRLRAMRGVLRVTLTSSARQQSPAGSSSTSTSSGTASTPVSAGGATGSASSTGCGSGPVFDIIVFFHGPGGTSPTGTPAPGGTPSAAAPGATTSSTTTSTTSTTTAGSPK